MVGLFYDSFFFFSNILVMAKQRQIGTTAQATDTAASVMAASDPDTASFVESDEIGSPYIA